MVLIANSAKTQRVALVEVRNATLTQHPVPLGLKTTKTIKKALTSLSKPRPKNRFVDDSAVEEDCDGASIPSRASTPDQEIPTTASLKRREGDFPIPKLSPPVDDPVQEHPISQPTQVVPVNCQKCGIKCSSQRQLLTHQSSKKCRNRADHKLKH